MLQKILNSLGLYYKQPEIPRDKLEKDPEKEEHYIGSLSFRLTEDYDIDIVCGFPGTADKSDEELLDSAEKFAEFLMQINEGYLKEDVVNLIKNSAVKTPDDRYYLFLENVVVFWAMLHVEKQKEKKQKEKKDQPVIRPLSVFNRMEN